MNYAGIKWKNVDFFNKIITVRQSYQREDNFEFENVEIKKHGSSLVETKLKSQKSKREIPMSNGVYNILLYIYKLNQYRNIDVSDDQYVFINSIGNPVTGECLRTRLYRLLKKHKLKGVSLHRFRHTFATRLFEATVDIKYIQELLGHSSLKVTERYVHTNKTDKAEKIKVLENYYKELGFCVDL